MGVDTAAVEPRPFAAVEGGDAHTIGEIGLIGGIHGKAGFPQAYGLGAVWTGGYPSEERVAILRSVLNIPDKFIPLNMIPVGHPAESPEPKNKWNPDNVYRNKFAADTIR